MTTTGAKALHAAVVKELGREPTIDEVRALVHYFDCSLSLDGDVQCETCRKRINPAEAGAFDADECVYLCMDCVGPVPP